MFLPPPRTKVDEHIKYEYERNIIKHFTDHFDQYMAERDADTVVPGGRGWSGLGVVGGVGHS